MQSPPPNHRSQDNYGSNNSIRSNMYGVLSTPTSHASLALPHKLPAHTEIHTTSPIAAGLPILEIVKNLEEEKIINREDRAILKDALYSADPVRREEMIKALCDVELSSHSRFAIRRLKATIHQNGAGEVSSKSIQQLNRQQSNKNNQEIPTHIGPGNYGQPGVPHRSTSDTSAVSNIQYVPSGMDGSHQNNNNDRNANNNSKHVRASFPSSGSKVRPDDVMLPALQSHSEFSTPAAPSHSPKHQQHTNNNMSHNNQHQPITSARAVLQHQQQPQQVSPQPPTNSRRNNNESSPTINKSGNSNSKQKKETNEDDDSEEAEDRFNVQSTVSQVVGTQPMYASQGDTFNVMSKILVRYQDIVKKMDPVKLSQRKLAILVGSGSFNPLTRMHLRTFFLAKQYLESHLGYVVLGSLLSPAHAVTVRERYRTNPQEILPAPHRLAIAQLLVSNSQWVSIDPWEMTRRRAMDYLSLLEHVQQLIQASFPSIPNDSSFVPGVHVPDIRLVYVCKGNSVPKLSPQALKSLPCHCVSVCRTQESDILRTSLTGKWNGVISVVEDAAILDASFDMVTSRKVRDKIKAGESVETLVGGKIQEYCLMHKLGPKMNGAEEWTTEESQMPKIASRPAEPTLRSQQLQLQLGSIRSHNSLMQSPMSLNSHNSNQFTFNSINNNNSNIQKANGQPRTVPVQAMQPNASPSLLQKNGLASLGVAYSVK